ncbi:imidazole glycerol phosphate synthase subunit HisH [Candidatus Palauibacter sp.]|uniref:imidazole glycerol phosphate synthase subunit HisH n=1 Tax=Candidatus Palauibacter sp. TaxID=3101350 RepID=UPI003C6F4C49
MSAARVATGGYEVGIVPTGVANLETVVAAFRRLGRTPRVLDSATDIRDAEYVVLPGVGSFADGLAELRRQGWDEALRRRIRELRPTLGICLGLQLLCEWSDEAPGIPGLGCVPGRTVRLAGGCRVPQLGWNRITAPADAVFLRSGIFYFANSYRLEAVPPDWTGAIGLHGTRFVAGLERGGVLACQFHPELSGKTGAALLGRWLEQTPAAEAHDGSRTRVRLAAAC